MLDSFHMLTVTITANACTKYCLRKIIAYIKAEFAPNFFYYMLGNAIMNTCTIKQSLHCLYSITYKRSFIFAINNPDGSIWIKYHTITISLRSYFDKCWQYFSLTNCLTYDIFTFYAIHKAHYNSIFTSNRLNIT